MDEGSPTALGANVARVMKRHGWSYRAAGIACGMDASLIRKMRIKGTASAETIRRFALAIHEDPSQWLLWGNRGGSEDVPQSGAMILTDQRAEYDTGDQSDATVDLSDLSDADRDLVLAFVDRLRGRAD